MKAYTLVNTPMKYDHNHWNFLEESTKSCGYCDKCRQDFNRLKNGCEVIVKAQEALKACLDRIEAIVVEARALQKSGSRPRKRKIVVVAEEDEADEITQHPRYSDNEGQANEGTNTGDDWMNDEETNSSSSDCDVPSKRKKSENSSKLSKDEPSSDSDYKPNKSYVVKCSATDWITCGIDKCARSFSYRVNWSMHARKWHPDADLDERWRLIASQRKKVVCQIDGCERGFLRKQLYKQHVKSAHPLHFRDLGLDLGPPVHCDVCRDNIPRTKIAEHIQGHVGDYVLSCPNPDCSLVFGTVKYFKLHLFSRNSLCKTFARDKDKFDVCEICSYSGTTHQGLHNHLMVVHETNPSKSFPCPVAGCSDKFSNRQTVFFHISLRHAAPHRATLMATNSFQHCPECSNQVQFDQIPDHFQKSHGVPIESAFSCKYCPYKAITHLQLIDHFLVHFRAGISVSCDICPEDKKFPRLGSLRQHYLDHHRIGNSFICEHCSNVFTVENALKHHIKRYHSGGPLPKCHANLKCDQCPPEDSQRYRNIATLMRHKIVDHGAEPFKCTNCLKTFTSWCVLSKHLAVHKNIAPRAFPCDIPGCSHVAITPASLAKHKASIKHVGRMNSFQCDQCEKGFNTKGNLHNHKRFVHVGKRTFVCDVCGMGFKQREALVQHTRIHTGERPHQCHLCPKRFRRTHHLKGHLKTHKPSDQPIS